MKVFYKRLYATFAVALFTGLSFAQTEKDTVYVFLENMPEDHLWMDLYRQSNIIICCGQGAWEDEMRVDLHKIDDVLTRKGVSHWADYWGYDVNHDWPWWKKQLPYFMSNILGNP